MPIIRAEGFPFEFYDLEIDSGETINRVNGPSDIKEIADLKSEIGKWFHDAAAPPIGDWRSTAKQNLIWYGPFPGANNRLKQFGCRMRLVFKRLLKFST